MTSNAENFEDAKPVRQRHLCSIGPVKFILRPAARFPQDMLKTLNKIGLTRMKAYQASFMGGLGVFSFACCVIIDVFLVLPAVFLAV